MKSINLDELATQQFPSSLFNQLDEQTLVHVFKAYQQGFKDGYATNHGGVTIEVKRNPTLGELLYAANKERS